MKFAGLDTLLREQIQDAPEGEWLDRVLDAINHNAEQTSQAFQGAITNEDNTRSGYGVYQLTHGSSVNIANPLKVRPKGIKAIRTIAVPGSTRPRIVNLDWEFYDTPTDERAPQQLRITPYFDLDHTKPLLSLSKSANQAIPTNGAFLTWDTIVTQRPAATNINNGIIYVDSGDASKIKTTEPGSLLFNFNVALEQNAGGNIRASWAVLTGSTRRRAEMQLKPAAGQFGYFGVGSVVYDMTTSDYVQIMCFHDVAATNLNAGGGATDDACYLQVSRTYNNSTPSADVVLFFDGG